MNARTLIAKPGGKGVCISTLHTEVTTTTKRLSRQAGYSQQDVGAVPFEVITNTGEC